MCKIRDIILVDKFKSEGSNVGRHSFVVISDENGVIQGMPYDMVCNVLSSFKSIEQRKRKLSYPGNFPISVEDVNIPHGNSKSGFIKADQFYYFEKDKISYRVIGRMEPDAFDELIEFINNADYDIIHITDNL